MYVPGLLRLRYLSCACDATVVEVGDVAVGARAAGRQMHLRHLATKGMWRENGRKCTQSCSHSGPSLNSFDAFEKAD